MKIVDFDPFAIVDSIIRERTKLVDETAFYAFNKYGYSKEWVCDPANKDRIRIDRISTKYVFKVDNYYLFSLDIKPVETGDYKVSFECDLKYIAPLPTDEPTHEFLTKHFNIPKEENKE